MIGLNFEVILNPAVHNFRSLALVSFINLKLENQNSAHICFQIERCKKSPQYKKNAMFYSEN